MFLFLTGAMLCTTARFATKAMIHSVSITYLAAFFATLYFWDDAQAAGIPRSLLQAWYALILR